VEQGALARAGQARGPAAIDGRPEARGATTIVTTPVHLGGLGTDRMVLRPLATADATRLLHRAVTMAHPDDTRILDHPEDAARVADLCDGLPLALRTAAVLLAESPHRPLATLTADLADPRTRLAELVYPDRDLRTRLDTGHARLDPARPGCCDCSPTATNPRRPHRHSPHSARNPRTSSATGSHRSCT
jgi:hypothetical protein